MVISELALGLLTNLLYDSAKKIPSILFDPSSKAYKNAIRELNKKYRQSGKQIEIFLHQDNVKTAIKEYLEKPNSNDLLKSLTDDFLASLNKENFSREYAKSILSTFFEILDHEIEKDPELRENLKLYLAKRTYLTIQETNELARETNHTSQNTLEVAQEIRKDVKEICKVISDGRADRSKKESVLDFQESITKYLHKIIAEDSEIGISEVYTELSAKEILSISLKFHDEKSDRTRDYEVLELVKKEERLIITGESGAGKTTTLKWLNFIYATNYLEGKSEIIPLYVELNSYTKGSFYDNVRIKAQRNGISKDILEILLKVEAILFIDGFDLLSPTDGFFPYEEISNFVSEYSNCRFVISSRPDFFESIRSDFKISELEKLTYEKNPDVHL
jgi:predicted NACHT family NTPase